MLKYKTSEGEVGRLTIWLLVVLDNGVNRTAKAILVFLSAVVLGACNVKSSTSKGSIGAGWEMYKSDKFGYSIQHPKGWTVRDNSSETSRQVYIYEPDKRAYVKIDAFVDDRVNSADAMKSVTAQFKQRMEEEEGMTLVKFSDSIEGNNGGYIANGEQTVEGEVFLFESRGLISTNGRTLIFHRAVKKGAFDELDETLSKIIKSFSVGG